MAKIPDKIKVGAYRLGMRTFNLYADPSKEGGRFQFTSSAGSLPEMTIGIIGRWGDVVDSLLHESMEAAFVDLNVQFTKYGQYAESTDTRWFMFDHATFTEAASRSGWFMMKALPDLSEAYNASHKKPKKLTRRKK